MSSSSTLTMDHQQQHQQQQQIVNPSSEQLCYVHCNICDTVLAVSVPCTSLFKMVTVRCGHCTNLLSVNMRGLLLPSANHHLDLNHSLFSPSSSNLLEEIINPTPNFLLTQSNNASEVMVSARGGRSVEDHHHHHQRPLVTNKPPEKRQRVPSAYNRFIKDEIQRIKAGNPDISHREAFSAAAKNWAHFPHIHFGLMPDQMMKKATVRQQDVEQDHGLMKDAATAGFFAAANVGLSPY